MSDFTVKKVPLVINRRNDTFWNFFYDSWAKIIGKVPFPVDTVVMIMASVDLKGIPPETELDPKT